MALLTVERNTPSVESTTDTEEETETLSGSSSLEGFVTTRNFAMCLPQRHWTQITRGDPMHIHFLLQKLVKMMRPRDTLRMCVELERIRDAGLRYLVIVTTQGQQDTEEAILLGTEMTGKEVTVGLVLPVWRDTHIRLDGDGGFIVTTGDRHHVFKTTSVQSMWTALQSLYKLVDVAVQQNYYVQGLSHTWVAWYEQQLTRDRLSLNEWNKTEDIHSTFPDSLTLMSRRDSIAIQRLVINKLREIMQLVDLEEVTSKQIRMRLEEETQLDLTKFRNFIDQTILMICGQMEKPSKIKDYLYLGSEWNATNFEELQSLGVKYILNCTREIDNFFPDMFSYKNIKVYDKEDSDLMRHWDDTFRFIAEAKNKGTKILVHCRMGISRSAATVMAYLMKMYSMTYEDARSFVKTHRSCVNPNPGFVHQLKSYEGILNARNNPLWGAQANMRTKHQRSRSDPDLKGPIENLLQPHLALNLPLGSTPNIDKVGAPEGHDHRKDTPSTSKITISRTVSTPQCVQDAKNLHLMTFLASLPSEEEDQGITENTTSESTSNFSSPMSLTPPDKECYLNAKKQTLKILSEAVNDCEGEETELLGVPGHQADPRVDRRGSAPFLTPKLIRASATKQDPFFQGKRASVADVLITLTNEDNMLVNIVPDSRLSVDDGIQVIGDLDNHSSEVLDYEEELLLEGINGGEVVETEKLTKLSLSHSFPEELNCSTSEEQTPSKQQHRRSRSEITFEDLDIKPEEMDTSDAPVFEPQFKGVQDTVKMIETLSSQDSSQDSSLKVYKRVYSAPSLATVSTTAPITIGTGPQALRPSSRASNRSEIIEEDEGSEEEETIAFNITDIGNPTSPAPSSPVQHINTPREEPTIRTEVVCDVGAEEVPEVTPTNQIVDELQETQQPKRWEPSHTRSRSNIETSNVRALINSLEEKARSGSFGSRNFSRSTKESKGEMEDSVQLSSETQSVCSDHLESDVGRPCGLDHPQTGPQVKRVLSMSSLGSGDSGTSFYALQRSGSKRDSGVLMVPGSLPSVIPEGALPQDSTVDVDATLKNVEEQKVQLDTAVEEKEEQKVQLDTAVEEKEEQKVQLDTAVEEKEEQKVQLDTAVEEKVEQKNQPNATVNHTEEQKDLSDTDSVTSVLELMQKFESKPHIPEQVRHTFSSSPSSSSLSKILTGGKTDSISPMLSDEERSKSGSPCPSGTGMTSVEVQ